MARARLVKRRKHPESEPSPEIKEPEGLQELGTDIGDFRVIGVTVASERDVCTWSYVMRCNRCGFTARIPHEYVYRNTGCHFCSCVHSAAPREVQDLYLEHVRACVSYGVTPQGWQSFWQELTKDRRAFQKKGNGT